MNLKRETVMWLLLNAMPELGDIARPRETQEQVESLCLRLLEEGEEVWTMMAVGDQRCPMCLWLLVDCEDVEGWHCNGCDLHFDKEKSGDEVHSQR